MEVNHVEINGKSYTIMISPNGINGWTVSLLEKNQQQIPAPIPCEVINSTIVQHTTNELLEYNLFFKIDNHIFHAKVIKHQRENTYQVYLVQDAQNFIITQSNTNNKNTDIVQANTPLANDNLVLKSPLAGLVVKIHVTAGQAVSKNQPILIIESMKMENEICAPFSAFIKTLSISEGNLVKPNQVLVTFEEKRGEGDAAAEEPLPEDFKR